MPIGSIDGETLRVITERRDLGYGRGRRGNWWALRAFGAMCDRQIDLPYPYTLWHFPAHIRLAVERVLAERSRELAVLPKAAFERVLGEIGARLECGRGRTRRSRWPGTKGEALVRVWRASALVGGPGRGGDSLDSQGSRGNSGPGRGNEQGQWKGVASTAL